MFIVIVSGVFVAGTDAGLLYNTYPLMNEKIFPEGLLDLDPIVKNIFENLITINFLHRILTIITFFLVIFIWLRKVFFDRSEISYRYHLLLLCVILQFIIGITLVIFSIPTFYAILHHLGALLLMSCAIFSFHVEVYEQK